MKRLIIIPLLFFCLFASGQFTKTFYYRCGGVAPDAAQVAIYAKYDYLIGFNRFYHASVGGDTWAALKAINPNIKICLYEMASESSNLQDSLDVEYLNTIARYNVDRGHSQGDLNNDNPTYFLLDGSSNRIENIAWPNNWANDIGSAGFRSYFNEALITDLVGQDWTTDGIYLDGLTATLEGSGWSATPALYPNSATWIPAMNGFINSVTIAAHNNSQIIGGNRGNTKTADGSAAWLALDTISNPPDYALEEGTFALEWGTGDVQWLSEEEWLRSLNVLKTVTNYKVFYQAHSNLTSLTGLDADGKDVSCPIDPLWFSLASFHLGSNSNTYFSFNNLYSSAVRYDEYDNIDLGAPLGDYTSEVVDGVNIYKREFTLGYVYVNPTTTDVTGITLPRKCRQLTHDNMSDPSVIPLVNSIDLAAHRGTFLLKATTFLKKGTKFLKSSSGKFLIY